MAWDDSASGKRPGVMVIHECWGLNDYAVLRAKQLAAEGYVAFAADMYGDDKVTEHADEAGAWMKQITGNIGAWRARANASLAAFKAQPEVDSGQKHCLMPKITRMPCMAVQRYHGRPVHYCRDQVVKSHRFQVSRCGAAPGGEVVTWMVYSSNWTIATSEPALASPAGTVYSKPCRL